MSMNIYKNDLNLMVEAVRDERWKDAEQCAGRIMGISYRNKNHNLCEKSIKLQTKVCDKHCYINGYALSLTGLFQAIARGSYYPEFQGDYKEIMIELQKIIDKEL